MNNFKTWLQDRKNLPIVVAAAAIVVILVVLVFLRMTGKIGGGSATTATAPTPAGSAGMPGAPEMPPGAPGMPPVETPPGMAPGAPGAPVEPGMAAATGAPGAPGAPAGQPTAGAPSAPAPSGVKQPPMLPYRKDPFMSFSGPPKRKDALMALLPTVRRERLAPAPVIRTVQTEIPEVLPAQPPMRMAGIMWNGKVSAILEINGQAEIVRPGMVPKNNPDVQVESIQPNRIILKTLNTRRPMTIEVNMAGALNPNAGSPQPNAPGPAAPPMFPGGPPGMEGPPPPQ